MAFMAMSLLLDRQPELRVTQSDDRRDDRDRGAATRKPGIAETIRSAVQTDYTGPVTFMLADNGSTDADLPGRTHTWLTALGVELVVMHEPKPGKANALNHALPHGGDAVRRDRRRRHAAPSRGAAAPGRAARERAARHGCGRRAR